METREGGSWGLSSASVHTHEIRIYTVTVVYYACLCDAMLVSAGNSLWTRGHGLQTPDYSPQAIDMTQAVDTRGEDHRLQTTDYRSQSMDHGQ